MAHEPCSVEDLWAGDRSRVGVCVSVTPKDGVRYEDLQREVFCCGYRSDQLWDLQGNANRDSLFDPSAISLDGVS